MFRLLPLALAISFIANDASAQTGKAAPIDVYNLSLTELGQVQISTATGSQTTLDKTPATASVVYAAEIEAMGARTLDDILESIPGLHVSASSLSRLDSIFSMRGIHTGFNPQVLLLVNGFPVQSGIQGGHPTMFRMPVSAIERVEVIRGPVSAIYGADAYSGVINVITKAPDTIKGPQMGARAGSFNSRELWVEHATEWEGIGIGFNMAYQKTDGDLGRVVDSDLQSVLDKALGTNVSLAPGPLATRYQVVDTHLALTGDRFRFNLWGWKSINAGEGAGGAQAIDPEGRTDDGLVRGDLTYNLEKSEHWTSDLRLNYFHYLSSSYFVLLPAGARLPIGSDGNLNFVAPRGLVLFTDGLRGNPGGLTTDMLAELVNSYTGWDNHRVRVAVGTRKQRLEPRETKNFGPGVIDGTQPVVDGDVISVTGTPYLFVDGDKSVRRLSYLSLQDEWQLVPGLELTTGLRYDSYSDFGNTTNPRLGLVWSTTDKLTTKLLYGSAFRAPSFAELYYRNNPVSLGNEKLSPEKLKSLELSFNYRATENLQTNLTLFKYQATDMIEFLRDTNAVTKTAQNVRGQDGKGLEFEVNWKPSPQLSLGTSYAIQNAENDKTGTDIPEAPGKQFKLHANWEFAHDWSLYGQALWIADRARAADDTRPEVKDISLLNFTLHRKNILPDLDMAFALRNAADADIRSPSTPDIPNDYPMESRSAWLELNYTFK